MLIAAAAATGFNNDCLWQAPQPVNFGVAPCLIRIDYLSSIFLALVGVAGIASSLFSPGYLRHLRGRLSTGTYWACLYLFMMSMTAVLLSANVLTFLVFWEVMSLSSAALVASDSASHRVQKATLIYLGATRAATASLAGGFLWLYVLTGSWTFSDWHLNGPQFIAPLLLVLAGLLTKAGIWPFHGWLPYAHPAAPAPVSALMSGVMIKVAVYALIRFFVFGNATEPVFPYLLLFLGTVSAFWGVLFALKEQDLKSLLAYSSIENVGLIAMGIAACLYCRHFGFPQIAALALAATLFQCINHCLFKSLLFFSAGSIDAGAGTKDISLLGGLNKNMPYTSACFLTGCAAICALPPLNGFASKWLLYQSLFSLVWTSPSAINRAIGLACMGTLALVSGLAIACFTKAVGIACLGQPRTPAGQRAREGTKGMVAAQGVLVLACIAAGIAPAQILAWLEPLCCRISPPAIHLSSLFSIPQAQIFIALLALVMLIYLAVLQRHRAGVKRYVTWECGYGSLSARTEATGASFAQPVEHIFRGLLKFDFALTLFGKDRRHFPESISVETKTGQILETSLYAPVINAVVYLNQRLAALQAGSIHLYLLYMLVTLILLVAVGEKL